MLASPPNDFVERRSPPNLRQSSLLEPSLGPDVDRLEEIMDEIFVRLDQGFVNRTDRDWQIYSDQNHSRMVAAEMAKVANAAGCNIEEIKLHRLSGRAHDLGKTEKMFEMYRENRALSLEEIILMQKHPYYSGQKVLSIKQEFLRREEDRLLWPLVDRVMIVVADHHTPFNITDPDLRKTAARLEACDCFVTMQEDRQRPGKGLVKALEELNSLDEYLIAKNARHIECLDDINEAVSLIQSIYSTNPDELARQLG